MSPDRPMVWDCFALNDELDLLEFRLNYLAPVVDRFVIVEAPLTFSGKTKSLAFADNEVRYARWSSKIIHRVADLPALGDVHPRRREAAQKSTIREALRGVADTDLVLVGDLDEIPFREVVAELRDDLQAPTRLVMRWSMYRANFEAPHTWADGTKACRGRDLADEHEMGALLGVSGAPHMAGRDSHRLHDAGWHLSYIGSPQFVRSKVGAICERRFDRQDLVADSHLERCLDLAVFLDGRFAMRRLPAHEFDDLLKAVALDIPGSVDLGAAEASWKVRTYLAYTRLVYLNCVPAALARLVDRRPWPALRLLGVPMVLVDESLRLAGKHRIRHRLRHLAGTVGRR